MFDLLARLWRTMLTPGPTQDDRVDQTVRVIQRHLDEASRRRGGTPIQASDLEPEERAALARELAALLKPAAQRSSSPERASEANSEPHPPAS